MKKVKKINEMYFNACGCSSFDGNEDYGFKKDEDYDNGYNTPRYSNASGDVETLDIDDEMETSPFSSFDNFLYASKRKRKKLAQTKSQGKPANIQTQIEKGKAILDKAGKVVEVLEKPNSEEMQQEIKDETKPLIIEKKSNMMRNVLIGASVLVVLYFGYNMYVKSKSKK